MKKKLSMVYTIFPQCDCYVDDFEFDTDRIQYQINTNNYTVNNRYIEMAISVFKVHFYLDHIEVFFDEMLADYHEFDEMDKQVLVSIYKHLLE